jgi:hypothetical protein
MIYMTFKQWEDGNFLETGEPRKNAYLQAELDLVEMGWNYGYDAGVEWQREKVAQWMIDRGYATGHGDAIADLLKELEWQIRESEREACAKIADEWAVGWPHPSAVIAEQIRARGNNDKPI